MDKHKLLAGFYPLRLWNCIYIITNVWQLLCCLSIVQSIL